MSKGLVQFKKRHSNRNAQTAILSAQAIAFNKNRTVVNQICRLDSETLEVVKLTASEFRFKLLFERGFEVAKRFAPYSTTEQVARQELENDARLFTDKAEYWVEKQLIEPAAMAFKAAA